MAGLFDDVLNPSGSGLFDDVLKPKPNDQGDVARGFTRAFAQVPELAYGTGALAAMSAEKLFGEGGLSTAAKNYFGSKYAEKHADNEQYAPTVEFTDAWDNLGTNPGKMADWIQDSAGYVVGQGLQTIATGGIGALAGKMTLGSLVAGSAAKAADKMVAAEIAKRGLVGEAAETAAAAMLPTATAAAARNLSTALGSGIVLTGQNLGMEAGDIYGGLLEESKKTGKEITGSDLVRAWGAAGLAAGTETVTDLLGLGALTGRIKIGNKAIQEMTGIGGRAARAGVGAGIGSIMEGGQEWVQTGLEQWGAGSPLDTPEAAKERINAAAVGVLGGTIMGGGAGALQSQHPATVADIGKATTADEAVATAEAALAAPVDALAPAIDEFQSNFDANRVPADSAVPLVGVPDTAAPAPTIALPTDTMPATEPIADVPLSLTSEQIVATADRLAGMPVGAQTQELLALDRPTRQAVVRAMQPSGIVTPETVAPPGMGEAGRIINEATTAASSVQPTPAVSTGVPAYTQRAAREIVSKDPSQEMRPHRDVPNRFEVVPKMAQGQQPLDARAMPPTLPVSPTQQQLAEQEVPAAPATRPVVPAKPLTAAQVELNRMAADAERSSLPRRSIFRNSQLRDVDAPDIKGEKVTHNMRRFLTQIGKLTGTKVVFEFAPEDSEGAVPVRGENVIHINTAAQINPLQVMGHEVTHVLKDQHREAWTTIRDALVATMPDKRAALDAFAEDYWHTHPDRLEAARAMPDWSQKLTPEQMREFNSGENTIEAFLLDELTSDLGGSHWSNEQFWTDVFAKIEAKHGGEKAKGIIQRLVASIKEALNKFLMVVRAQKQGDYTTITPEQLEKTRDAVTSAYAKFINEERTATPQEYPVTDRRIRTSDVTSRSQGAEPVPARQQAAPAPDIDDLESERERELASLSPARAKPEWWNEPSTNAFAKGMTQGEVIQDALDRATSNGNLKQADDKYVFYHATPDKTLTTLRAGSLLEYNAKDAKYYARHNRGLRLKDVVAHELHLLPEQLNPPSGPWFSLRDDVRLSPQRKDQRLFFEVAPNPKDAAAVAAWQQRTDKEKQTVSNDVVQRPDVPARRTEQRPSSWYYSPLTRAAEAATMKTAPASGWKDWLKSLPAKGVKPDEIKWSGIEEWLDVQGKMPVTKQQVQSFLSDFGIKVETILRGERNPKSSDVVSQDIDADEEPADLEISFGEWETDEPDESWLADTARERLEEAIDDRVKHDKGDIEDQLSDHVEANVTPDRYIDDIRSDAGTLFPLTDDELDAEARRRAAMDYAAEHWQKFADDPDLTLDTGTEDAIAEAMERAFAVASGDMVALNAEAERRARAEIDENELLDELIDDEREYYYNDCDAPATRTISVEGMTHDFYHTSSYGDQRLMYRGDDIRLPRRADDADIEGAIRTYLAENDLWPEGVGSSDGTGFVPTKWEGFTTDEERAVPGSYREVQLTLPPGTHGEVKSRLLDEPIVTYNRYDSNDKLVGVTNNEDDAKQWAAENDGRYEKVVENTKSEHADAKDFIYTVHWNEKNVVGFARFDVHIDENGKRVMVLQEIQGDWGQQLRDGLKAQAEVDRLYPLVLEKRAEIKAIEDAVAPITNEGKDAPADMIGKHARLNDDLQVLERKLNQAESDARNIPDPAPFISTKKFAVFKDGVEVTRTDKNGKELAERYGSMKDAEAAAAKKGGEARDLGPQVDTPGWTTLVMKRMIAYAIEYGFDKIVWTNGAQQVERWKQRLRSQVDTIRWEKTEEGVHIVGLYRSRQVVDTKVKETALSNAIGKLMAKQIISDPNQSGEITGDGITIDDLGMHGYYDEIVPFTVNKLLEKLDRNVRVGMHEVHKGTSESDYRIISQNEKFEVRHKDYATPGMLSGYFNTLEMAESELAKHVAAKLATTITTQQGFEITDKLRESAANGLPLMSERRRAAADRKANDRRAWYYSQLGAAVNDIPRKIKTGKEAALWLQSNAAKLGVKKDELVWSGVLDWLAAQPTPAGVQEWLAGNGVRVREVVLGEESPEYRRLDEEWSVIDQQVDRFREAVLRISPLGIQATDNVRAAAAAQGDEYSLDLMKRQFNPEQLDAMLAYGRALNRKNEIFELRNAARGEPVKFDRPDLTLPGGSRYRELLLTLPGKPSLKVVEHPSKKGFALQYDNGAYVTSPDGGTTTEQTFDADKASLWDKKEYISEGIRAHDKTQFIGSHFPQPNIIAHLRFNERTDVDGKRVLFIEEVQSDYAQAGRRERKKIVAAKAKELGITEEAASKLVPVSAGFGSTPTFTIRLDGESRGDFASREDADRYLRENPAFEGGVVEQLKSKGVPAAPFVKDTKAWTALALKRAIAYAVDNGFDRVAWTTGEQQADRYDLSKQVESINYDPVDEWLTAYPKDSGRDNISQAAKLSELPGIIGKEAAKKIEQAIESAKYDREQWSVEEDDGKFIIIDPNGDPMYAYGGDLETFDTQAKAEEWIDANYNDGQKGVTISGLDLKVGGEGMRGFYDQIVPQVARSLGATMDSRAVKTREPFNGPLLKIGSDGTKYWLEESRSGNRVGSDTFASYAAADDARIATYEAEKTGATPQPGFDITDKMREQARIGMPLFSEPRRAAPAADERRVNVLDLSKSILSRMSLRLQTLGYDSRGSEDVRRALLERNGVITHPDWIEAYDAAISGAQRTRERMDAKAAEKGKATNVNFARMRELGLTEDWREAGYITPRGSLIDLSGKREGGPRGQRSYDHREAGGTIGMQEYMTLGNIRIDDSSGSMDISKVPTAEQYRRIAEFIENHNGEVTLDLEDGLGELRDDYYGKPDRSFSFQYPENVKSARIIADIKRFFSGQQPVALSRRQYSEQRRPLDQWLGKSKVRTVMYHGTARDISTFRPQQADAIFLTDNPEFAANFADLSRDWMLNNYWTWMTPDQIQQAKRDAMRLLLKDALPGSSLYMREERLLNQSQQPSQYMRRAVEPYMPSESNIMPLYVRAENPFDYRNPAHVAAIEREIGTSWLGQEAINGEMHEVSQHIGDLERGDWNAIESPQVQAYIRQHHDSFYVRERGVTNLAVFSPNQVKSASGNDGSYSRKDNDIRRSEQRLGVWSENADHLVPRGEIEWHKGPLGFAGSINGKHVASIRSGQSGQHLGRIEGWQWHVTPDSGTARFNKIPGDKIKTTVSKAFPSAAAAKKELQEILAPEQTRAGETARRSEPREVTKQAASVFFTKAEKLPRTEGIESAEEAWIGGVADFGDPEAATAIRTMRGYGSYRGELDDLARETFGDRFYVYRYGRFNEKALWDEFSNDDVPMATTLSIKFAKNFKSFAGFDEEQDDTPRRLMRIAATPESIVMIGHPQEHELVLSAANIEASDIEFIDEDFQPTDSDARFSTPRSRMTGQPINQSWTDPVVTDWDDLVRKMQDDKIDTKRVLRAIRDAGVAVKEKFDAYMLETNYHGRAAARVDAFADGELRKLMEDMAMRKLSMTDLDDYLWARHAPERNAANNRTNPAITDGSGMSDAQSAAILAGQAVTLNGRTIQLTPAALRAAAAVSSRVDAITSGTLDLLVSYGLETQQTVDTWKRTYAHYAPLKRDMESDSNYSGAFNLGNGTGTGFDVRGSASKRALGSKRAVTDILANIAMQRERAITRGEKNRVSQAVYGLALSAPNPEFWIPVNTELNKRLTPAALAKVVAELVGIGVNPIDAQNLATEPVQRYTDPTTGLESQRINPALRGRKTVLSTRINGEDRYVFFSNKKRAQEMVRGLKNLDAADVSGALQVIAPVTRWFAAVNTQYNPIFGMTNGVRDFSTGMLNLSSTPLSTDRAAVAKYAFSALRGIYADLRDHRAGRMPTSQWAQLFEQFELDGGRTGYRDMFATSTDRAKAIAKELKHAGKGKQWVIGGAKHSVVFGWLSDYNTAVENAMRLAAYKAALDKGMSRDAAASLAKNLTVNFNKKGLAATQTGALYAFFNAAVQGTARIAETTSKDGKLTAVGQKIVYGGMLVGVMQAIMGALAGWDDDEPPQFQREKNFIIPLPGTDKYLSIPMPLGFHVLPNVGRTVTEWMMSGFKDPGKRLVRLAGVVLDAFNPIGSGTLAQTLSPTIGDPIIALAENEDWTGKSIYKADFDKLHPTPGWTRTKDTASPPSKWMARAINYVTGGGKYEIGMWSPTPDTLDYLVGQAAGGTGREVLKTLQYVSSKVTGEELPIHKTPLGVGRFVGETKGQSSEMSRFYRNLERIGEHKSALREMKDAGDGAAIREYLAENPDARLVQTADKAQREIAYLRRQKREVLEKGGNAERVKMLDERITAMAARYNQVLRGR